MFMKPDPWKMFILGPYKNGLKPVTRFDSGQISVGKNDESFCAFMKGSSL